MIITASDWIQRRSIIGAMARLAALIVLLSALPFTASAQSDDQPAVIDLTPEEAQQLIAENPDIVILDVRTPVEFLVSHIENAVNVNYYSFSFRKKIKQLDRSKTYLVHCQTGVRSGKTLPIMLEAGFTNIYHLTDGFKAWSDADLPTT